MLYTDIACRLRNQEVVSTYLCQWCKYASKDPPWEKQCLLPTRRQTRINKLEERLKMNDELVQRWYEMNNPRMAQKVSNEGTSLLLELRTLKKEETEEQERKQMDQSKRTFVENELKRTLMAAEPHLTDVTYHETEMMQEVRLHIGNISKAVNVTGDSLPMLMKDVTARL